MAGVVVASASWMVKIAVAVGFVGQAESEEE
jgi:hypothetical protein